MHELSRWKYVLNTPESSSVLQHLIHWQLLLCTGASDAMWVQMRPNNCLPSFQIKQFTCRIQWNTETPAWILNGKAWEIAEYLVRLAYFWDLRWSQCGIVLHCTYWVPKLSLTKQEGFSPTPHLHGSSAVAVSADPLVWTQHHIPAVTIFSSSGTFAYARLPLTCASLCKLRKY